MIVNKKHILNILLFVTISTVLTYFMGELKSEPCKKNVLEIDTVGCYSYANSEKIFISEINGILEYSIFDRERQVYSNHTEPLKPSIYSRWLMFPQEEFIWFYSADIGGYLLVKSNNKYEKYSLEHAYKNKYIMPDFIQTRFLKKLKMRQTVKNRLGDE